MREDRNISAKRKIRFELTWSAIAGIGLVCFCIFLWMFLLGIWAGQTLFEPLKLKEKKQYQTERQIDGKQSEIERKNSR